MGNFERFRFKKCYIKITTDQLLNNNENIVAPYDYFLSLRPKYGDGITSWLDSSKTSTTQKAAQQSNMLELMVSTQNFPQARRYYFGRKKQWYIPFTPQIYKNETLSSSDNFTVPSGASGSYIQPVSGKHWFNTQSAGDEFFNAPIMFILPPITRLLGGTGGNTTQPKFTFELNCRVEAARNVDWGGGLTTIPSTKRQQRIVGGDEVYREPEALPTAHGSNLPDNFLDPVKQEITNQIVNSHPILGAAAAVLGLHNKRARHDEIK